MQVATAALDGLALLQIRGFAANCGHALIQTLERDDELLHHKVARTNLYNF